MNRRSTLVVMICGLALGGILPVSVDAGPVLLGSSPDGILYDIDPATGVASNPRDTGLRALRGLAFSPDGILYATSGVPGSGRALFQIDPQAGTATGISVLDRSARDVGFDPTTSLLLGATNSSSSGTTLFSIDPNTGTTTDITNVPYRRGAITVNGIGDAFLLDTFMTSDDTLLSIDKVSGAILSEWILDVDLGMAGTTFLSNNELLIADGGDAATNLLYMFVTDSGVMQAIGSTGLESGIIALAYVPEPATLTLLGTLLTVVIAMRRRRSSVG